MIIIMFYIIYIICNGCVSSSLFFYFKVLTRPISALIIFDAISILIPFGLDKYFTIIKQIKKLLLL